MLLPVVKTLVNLCKYNVIIPPPSTTQSSLRSYEFLTQPRNSPYFIRHEGLLPRLKNPATSSILSQINLVHVSPTHLFKSIFLFFHPRLGVSSFFFPPGFPTQACIQLFTPPYLLNASSISFFFILPPEKYVVSRKNHKPPRYVVFSTPCYLIPLRLQYFLSTLFSNTLSLCSSFHVTDLVSHVHKTSKITVLCILIFLFLDSKLEDKRFFDKL
jgi:hypothetical protein